MSQLIYIILAILGGMVVGLLPFFFIRFLGQRKKGEGEDKAMLMLQEQLKEIRGTLDMKLGESNRAMQEQSGHTTRLIKEITQELVKVGEGQKQVVGFADQLQGLQDILKNPKQRGVLGEYYLESVLKNVLPPKSYQMQYKFKDGEIVDAVVFVKDKIIPIDSKFSLENYNRILGERDPLEKEKLDLFHSPTGSLPLSYKGKSIVTVHDLAIYQHPEWFPSNFLVGQKFSTKTIVPKSLKKAKKIYLFGQGHPLEEKFFVKKDSVMSDIGGSVATAAAVLALRFGAKCIVLVGQDLALTEKKMYSRGNVQEEEKISRSTRFCSAENCIMSLWRQRNLRRVQSVDGNWVMTTPVLDSYRLHFEKIALENPQVRFIQTSMHGAKIGIEHIPISKLLEMLSKGADRNE